MVPMEFYHPHSERIITDFMFYVLNYCLGPADREHCLTVLRMLPYLNDTQRAWCSGAVDRRIHYLAPQDRPPFGPELPLLNGAPLGPHPIPNC
jgi:hypothetical protein